MIRRDILFFFVFFIIAYFPLFHHLDHLVIRLWDEGQNSVNAFEMLQRGSWFVKYFNGEPDMWETKPPFFIWYVIVFMKLLGPTELSLRLPSALYTLAGCFLMIRFTDKSINNRYIGFVASIIVITSLGVVGRHNARTGDTDATLVFYLLLSTLSFYLFLHKEKLKRQYFWLFSTSLFLAIFTKSITGCLMLPSLFIYALIERKLKYIFSFRDLYLALILFSALLFAYYFHHESLTPGYLASLYDGELGGRYTDHSSGFSWFYFENFWKNRFSFWFWLLPVSFFSISAFGSRNDKRLGLFLFLVITITISILSFGAKNLWYDAPLYPFMSLACGIGLILLHRKLTSIIKFKPAKYIAITLFLAYAGHAYSKVISTTFAPKEEFWDIERFAVNYYLRNALESNITLNQLKIIYEEYPSSVLFYIYASNEQKGNELSLYDWSGLKEGDKILLSQKETKNKIFNKYKLKLIDSYGAAERYAVIGEVVEAETKEY